MKLSYTLWLSLVLCAMLASCYTAERGVAGLDASGMDCSATKVAKTVPEAIAHQGARAVLVAESPAALISDEDRGVRLLSSLNVLTPELREALEVQRQLLKRQSPHKTYSYGGRTLTRRDFMQVIDDLLSGRFRSAPLTTTSVATNASVRFTGYYSPEILVSAKKSARFRYPVLAYPEAHEGPLPSRYDIERGGALEGKTKILCYAEHVLDVYTLQLQGSGFVRFSDGSLKYLAYGGTNRYPYQSIGLALQRRDSTVTDISHRGLRTWISANAAQRDSITTFNPNYGFFREAEGKATGAAGVPLQPMISVAADPEHYPLGSVLLARVPKVNAPGQFETRILLVQDTGGAINGAGHLDLYTGVGEKALDIAERTGTSGEVYLLMPS